MISRERTEAKGISFITFILSHYAFHFGNYVMLLPGRDEIWQIVHGLHVGGGDSIICTAHNFYKVWIIVITKTLSFQKMFFCVSVLIFVLI